MVFKQFKHFDHYIIYLLPFFIPFPTRVTGIVIFIFAAISLLRSFFFDGEGFGHKFFKNPFILLLSVFFVIVLAGSMRGDFGTAWPEVERALLILALPIIVYQCKSKSLIHIQFIIISFSLGCFVIGLFTMVDILAGKALSELLGGKEGLYIHPFYLSSYFIFIFFFVSEELRLKRAVISKKELSIYVFSLAYCLGAVIFLRSQIPLLLFPLLVVVYFVIISKKRAWLVTFILFMVVFLVYLLDTYRGSTFFDSYGKNVSSALDNRIKLWSGVWEAIKMSPVMGAGTGVEQELINKGYEKIGFEEGIKNSFNAHNQYLQFWVRNGLPELTCFLVLQVFLFRQALKLRSLSFLIFLMMVSMIMFTESFLNVQKGIVFFYFFIPVFTMIPEEYSIPSTDR
jgi:O-antigen ligase